MPDFRARSKSRVLDELVEKLRLLPANHPDRPRLIRMIIDLRCEIERRDDTASPVAADINRRRSGCLHLAHRVEQLLSATSDIIDNLKSDHWYRAQGLLVDGGEAAGMRAQGRHPRLTLRWTT